MPRATMTWSARVRLKMVLMGLLAAMPGASAMANPNVEAAIALCSSGVPGARHPVLLPLAGRPPQSLVVAPLAELAARADCQIVRTGFPLDSIVWLGAARNEELVRGARIALTERAEDQTILALEVDAVRPPPKRKLLVPRAEVLPVAGFRLFGAEERTSAGPDVAAFEITCRRGRKIAGAVLDIGKVPPKAALVLELQAEATKGFSAQLIRADAEATERGLDFPTTEEARVVLPMTEEGAAALVITCPEGDGRLRLERVTVRSAEERPLDRPGAWIWDPEAWTRNPQRLLDAAERLGLGRLFISVPIADGKVPEAASLAAFVAAANERSIAVAAVEGDPGMISGEGRDYARARARALAAYNAGAEPHQRFSGVQYDIEPYLGSGYAARSGAIWQLWAETLLTLAGAVGEKIDAVVPYWMLETEAGAEALEQVALVLDRVTIMAYRTNPADIASAALPILAWSATHNIDATIALELGKLAPERRRVYVPAAEGDLHVIRFDDVAAVVVLDRVRTGPTGRAYRLSHTVPSDTSRITFDGDVTTALAVAAEVAPDVTAWPSARGFAFHGLNELAADAQENAR